MIVSFSILTLAFTKVLGVVHSTLAFFPQRCCVAASL